jgi:hypothetical protein
LHVWQHLQVLTVDGLNFDDSAMADFLEAHQGTLTRIELTYVFPNKGSWVRILQAIRNLPHLNSLHICTLNHYLSHTVMRIDSGTTSRLKCKNRSEILLALGALLSAPCT